MKSDPLALSPLPDFELPATSGKTFRLADQRGRFVVLYFYPKDSTPGCTTEAAEFRDLYAEFTRRGVEIWGLSRDSLSSHERFKEKLGLPFELISDAEEVACRLFDVMRTKKLYGKEVRGIERSTFLIDPQGRIHRAWRAVKPAGHAAEVLAHIDAFLAQPQTS
ncbi:MAG: peroxiredoxin [Rhodocyclaceae bacterium]|nr:peroxiredoxin [Rhodocyclaceae bacterium]